MYSFEGLSVVIGVITLRVVVAISGAMEVIVMLSKASPMLSRDALRLINLERGRRAFRGGGIGGGLFVLLWLGCEAPGCLMAICVALVLGDVGRSGADDRNPEEMTSTIKGDPPLPFSEAVLSS
jgi:hypothetical protein